MQMAELRLRESAKKDIGFYAIAIPRLDWIAAAKLPPPTICSLPTGLGERVVSRLRELAPHGQRESGFMQPKDLSFAHPCILKRVV